MADIEEVVATAVKEVKEAGTRWEKLHDQNQRDLEAIRSQVEGLKKDQITDPILKEKIEAFGAAIATRTDEAQKAAKKQHDELTSRLDNLETALKRSVPGLGHNGGPPLDAKEIELSTEFTKSVLRIRKGHVPQGINPDEANADVYREYCKSLDAYLRSEKDQVLPDVHHKALQVGSDPDGGYLVPPEMSARIISRVIERSPIREAATVETISGTELDFRLDMDDVDFEWIGETDLPAASKTPQIGRKKIMVHTMAARPKATMQVLEDAGFNLENWLARKIGDKFGRGENRAFLLGTGRGMPRGILTYPDGLEGVGETIEQHPTGLADGYTYEAVVAMIYSLKEPYHNNAGWWMQRTSIGKVMLIKDGNGTYMYKNILMPGQRGLESQLAGYPLRMAADIPASVPGALCAIFGDLRQAYTVVDRMGITTQRDPYTVKPFIEYFTRRRVGGDVVNFEAVKLMRAAASV